ncbi:polymeric immunoglobulin receptor, partial [Larimichthys crocea]|uniref:polymeric immunoglobulin receptor n=1 Tax=Larimichthys crocea TaxID=215358 RepID=UPI000F5E9082
MIPPPSSLNSSTDYVSLVPLSEIHSEIMTVSEVSVQAGRSISIPCLYDPRYTNHVKYLCKGGTWNLCKLVVTTDQESSGKYSISDDKNRRIFTVTINDLTSGDTGLWWCVVEINGGSDEKAYFHLSVTKDMPSLSVEQQEIVAFEGGSVTVICRYTNDRVTEWCRLNNTCVTAKDQTGTIDGTTVTINQSVPNVFIVTMSELKADSMNWYLCKSQNLQIPVHISVHKLTSATTTTAETLPTTPQHSSLLTSAETHTAQPTNPTINGTGGDSLQAEHKISTRTMILITSLTLSLIVLFLVPAAFF